MGPRKRKLSKSPENRDPKKTMPDPAEPNPDKSSRTSVIVDLRPLIDESNPCVESLFILVETEDKSGLDSAISTLNWEDLSKFWSSLQVFCAEAILAILQAKTDQDKTVAKNGEKVINACLQVAKINLDHVQADSMPEGLQQSVFLLHGAIPSLSNDFDTLKNSISKICELWFTKNFPNKDSLCLNVIKYLLQKTTNSRGTKADIKRLLQVQSLLKCQTLQDPANDKLKQLLLKAVQTSAFIKSNEGQKFIVGLFTLSPAFIKHIQNAIKAVIPGCSRQDAKDYGEIYFKAWNSAGDQLVLTIEEDCIQNFMYHCVLANKKAKIFEPLLVLLGSFHHAKNNKKAQSMVQRLWEPLLWRHLKVANSEVRGNAVQILTEAFPLEDPEAELEVRASSQEAQVKGFHELLKDECPEVRVLAIQGVASILSKYWLIFSSTELKDFMVVIVKYLANDMSSPKVRLAVVKAMTHLVQNCPRSHLYLKQILPKLGEVLFDSNEAVRSSMLDLLSAVKAIKAIPFWSICPLDDLLDRLGKDKKCVAQKIVNLLFNSFFPLEQSEEAKIERCTYLIKHDPEASRRFYLYCEKLLSLHDSVKFMLAILVNLKKHAKYVPDDHGQEEEEDKENVSANRRDSLAAAAGDHLEVTLNTTRKDGTIRLANDTLEASLSDSLVVGGLVDIVCVIWMIRSKELAEKENNEYRSLLEKKSAKILTVLFKQYRSCHVHRSVIYLCSFLPHSSALTISSFCLSRLKCAEITDDVVQKFPSWTENQNLKLNEELIFTTYVDALCNWRRGDDILELILQWLTRDLSERRGQKKKAKGVRFDEAKEKSRPGFGLVLLRYLLSHVLNRAILLKKNLSQLEDIKNILMAYQEFIPKCLDDKVNLKKVDLEGNQEVLASSWMIHLQLEVVLHLAKKPENNAEILRNTEGKLDWVKNHIMGKVGQAPLASHVMNSMMLMTSNLVTLNICDANLADHAIQTAKEFINEDSDSRLKHIKSSLPLMCEIASWTAFSKAAQNDANATLVFSTDLPEMFKNVCQAFKNQFAEEVILAKTDIQELRKYLVNFLDIYLTKFEDVVAENVLQHFQDAILECLKIRINQVEIVELVSISKEFSILGLFLDVVSTKKILKHFLPKLISNLKTLAIPLNMTESSSYLSLAASINHQLKSAAPKSDLKELLLQVETQIKNVDQNEDDDLEVLRFSANQLLESVKKSLGMIST